MDNTYPITPTTHQWMNMDMDMEIPYHQELNYGLPKPYEGFSENFSESSDTMLNSSPPNTYTLENTTTTTIMNNHDHDHQKSSCSAGNVGELSPKTSIEKPVKRRSRASRRTPATLLNTSIKDFRSIVQQHTGWHTTTEIKNHKGPINLSFGVASSSSVEVSGNNNIDGCSYYEDQAQHFQENQHKFNYEACDGQGGGSLSGYTSVPSMDHYRWK